VARRDTLGVKMVRLEWPPRGWESRGMAAALAAVIVGVCLVGSAPLAGAEGACAGSDASSPRFCAQSGMADRALVVVASVVPVAPAPEPACWLPVCSTAPLAVLHPTSASPPRAPPAQL
jgi:hypothetical protein